MKTIIEFIPHEEQRYETPGDYYLDDDGNRVIRISQMGDTNSEMAVAIHEFVESYLCQQAGITDEEVDAWDNAWEEHPEFDRYEEPGNHPAAPYNNQHKAALAIERLFIAKVGDDWEEHDKRVLGYCT